MYGFVPFRGKQCQPTGYDPLAQIHIFKEVSYYIPYPQGMHLVLSEFGNAFPEQFIHDKLELILPLDEYKVAI